MARNPDFDSFQLSEGHVEFRNAIRQLALDKIAPRAAVLDGTGSFRGRCSEGMWIELADLSSQQA
jgi:hypothetical protein